MGMTPPERRQDSEQDFKHISAVFSVSSVFLDSISKTDNSAKSWLSEKADQWLKKPAILKIK